MTSIEGKVPPQALDVEEVVLGALMLERDAMIQTADLLDVDCFYKESHRIVYESAIMPLFSESKNIDLLTISDKLRKAGLLERVGGPYELSILTNKVASSANIKQHVLILKQYAIKRNVIKLANNMLVKAYGEMDVLDMLDTSAREFDQIGMQVASKPFKTMQEVVLGSMKEIEEVSKNEGELTGVASGFPDLDKITNGWQKSDLIILAARPGMGKTTLVLELMKNAAVKFGEEVAMFSLEMADIQLGKKSLASESGLDQDKLRNGNLSPKDWEQLNASIAPLEKAKIHIDDQAGISVFELKAKLRRLKHDRPKLGLVVIDYLQLMNGQDPNLKSQNREQQISYISRSLKEIAKEMNLPIIALSQLSRTVESRGGDKKPILADLRESGAIEQDADMVLFVYRPEYYGFEEDGAGNTTKDKAQLLIAKHRNGSLGEVTLGFLGAKSKFVNLEELYAQVPGMHDIFNEHNNDNDD